MNHLHKVAVDWIDLTGMASRHQTRPLRSMIICIIVRWASITSYLRGNLKILDFRLMDGLSTGWAGEMIFKFRWQFFSSWFYHSHPKRNETIANIMLQTIARMGRKEIKTKLIKNIHDEMLDSFFLLQDFYLMNWFDLKYTESMSIFLCSLGIQMVSNSQWIWVWGV